MQNLTGGHLVAKARMQRNGVNLGAKVACSVRAEILARGGGRKRRGKGQ